VDPSLQAALASVIPEMATASYGDAASHAEREDCVGSIARDGGIAQANSALELAAILDLHRERVNGKSCCDWECCINSTTAAEPKTPRLLSCGHAVNNGTG